MMQFARARRCGALFVTLVLTLVAATLPARAVGILDPFNIPGTLDSNVVQIGKNIPYDQGERHTLDVYVPQNPDESMPVVVFIYGGAWKFGSKNDYPFVGHAFAAKGFVTVIPDYRLVPEVQYPGFLQDNADALKWVQDNVARFGGDPERVFLVGHSAGAYNSVVLGMDGSFLRDAGAADLPIRAVAGISGPYAVYPFEFDELQQAFGNVDNPQLTQPANMPTDESVPLFLLQGSNDFIVSADNTRVMEAKFLGDGRAIETKIYDGLGHMEPVIALSSVWRWRTPVLDDIVGFFAQNGAFDPGAYDPVDLIAQNAVEDDAAASGDAPEVSLSDEVKQQREVARSALEALEAAARAGQL